MKAFIFLSSLRRGDYGNNFDSRYLGSELNLPWSQNLIDNLNILIIIPIVNPNLTDLKLIRTFIFNSKIH